MDTLWQDLRYGARTLLRAPGFTLTAVLALALGIGANTAVFSVVYAVLLKPLPYPNPDQLLFIHDTFPAVKEASVGFAKLQALSSGTRTLSALGGMTPAGLTLTGSGEPEQINATRVSAPFMEAVGVQPLLGRWFTPEEDLPNGPPAIILSYGLWQRRFGGDPAVLNTTIQVSGVSRTIVGIMPDGSGYPSTTSAWIPLAMSAATAPSSNFMRLIGRMRDGVTVEQVRQDLSAISDEFNRQTGQQRDVRVLPLYESQVSNNRRMLLVLQGAVAFVLLVACANVANLLLARSVARRRELAIRSAIGAGRARIFRQVLTESVMLSFTGGALGVLLASWLMRLFLSLSPNLPRVQTISVDGRILLFTLIVAVLTGVLFGLAPARHGFKADPNESLREGGTRSETGGSKGLSRVLVTAEVALALVLVIGAGLLVKSLVRMQSESPGYRTSDIFTFNISLPPVKYDSKTSPEFYRRLLEELRALPGVQSAAAINYVPTINWGFNGPFSVVGQPPFEKGKEPITEYRLVTPGYFATMGIPVKQGQEFTEANTTSDRPVAIINETMATRYFKGIDPIGARIQIGNQPTAYEVIGVVGDVRDATLDRAPVPEVFGPLAQNPSNGMGIVIRLADGLSLDAVVPGVRQRVAAIDPDLPLIRPQMLAASVEATTGNARMISLLTSVFALVGALLASIGIYSLIAYSVAQRTREIGIRVALGANRASVVRMVVAEGLTLAAGGLVIGLIGAYFLTQTLQTLLYEVEPTDPAVLSTTCAGVFVVAVLASVVPALRALRVDAMVALRAE
jgi:putative ABC transport system permease protein